MDEELERMIIRLIGDGSSYTKMMKSAVTDTISTAKAVEGAGKRIEGIRKNLEGVGKSVQTVGKNASQAGKVVSLSVTAPLVAMGSMATREFGNFNQAMTETYAKLGTQTPQVEKQMEDLAKSLSMGGEVAFNPTQLAKGYEELASAGLSAENSMLALPATAKFAQAGAFGLDVAVKNLTGSMAAYGYTADEMDPTEYSDKMLRFSDVLVGVANKTTTSVEYAAIAMATDAAQAAKDYGMSLEELGAVLGVFASKNIEAGEAGNMTGRAMRLMTSQFVAHREEWEGKGIKLADPETGNWVQFADAIGMLENALEGVHGPARTAMLDTLGFEALAQKSILPLIGQSKALKSQADLYKKSGTTSEMAAIQMTSFWNRLAPTTNALRVMAIEIGESLSPYILTLSGYVRDGVNAWREMSPETKKVVAVFLAVAAVMGPLLMGFGLFASLAGTAAVGVAFLLRPITGLMGLGLGLGGRLLDMGRSAVVGFGMLTSSAAKASAASLPMVSASLKESSQSLERFKALAAGAILAPSQLMKGWKGQSAAPRDTSGRFTGAPEPAMRDIGQQARQVFAQIQGYTTTTGNHVQAFLRGWNNGMRATRGAGGTFIQEQLTLTRKFGAESQYWMSRPAAYLRAMKLDDPWGGLVYAAKYDATKIGQVFKQAGSLGAIGLSMAFKTSVSAAAAAAKMSFAGVFIFIRSGAVLAGGALRSMGGGILRLIDWIGSLATTAGMFGGSFAAIATTVAGVTAVAGPAVGLLAGALGALLSPIGLIVAGVVGIGLAIASFSGVNFGAVWEKAQMKLGVFMTFARGFMANFQQNMGILLNWLSERWNAVWGGVKNVVTSAVNGVSEILVAFFPSLEGMWSNVAGGAEGAFGEAFSYVRQFFSMSLGFVSNFSENMSLLWGFLRENWREVLMDVGNFFATFAGGLGTNMVVGLKIMFRMWSAFGGWLVSMFKKLFSFEVVDAVLTGLIAIGSKIVEWGEAAWQTIKNVFSGKQSGAMTDFITKANEDIKKGGSNVNLLETFGDILKEEAVGFKNPLANVEMQSLKNMPKFNLEAAPMDLPQFNTYSGGFVGPMRESGEKYMGADVQAGGGEAGFVNNSPFAADMKPRAFEQSRVPEASAANNRNETMEMILKGITRLVEIEEGKGTVQPVILQEGGLRR